MRKTIKYNYVMAGVAALALTASAAGPAFAYYTIEDNGPDGSPAIYNEYGANEGNDENTQNASIEGSYSEDAVQDYLNAGTYIISDHLELENEYTESGTYYETTEFSFGSGLYVMIKDEDSSNKFYTLIKSAQNLEVGEPYLYREGDIGGRLLDDKYTSTHMASVNSEYSYVSYDMGGGKLAAQEALLNEEGIPQDEQKEGFTYIYLVSETPADYYQRLANEAAGYEEAAQLEDRQYMPVNNTKSDGQNYNNWTNLTEDDPMDYNDRITRIGGTEGESNTRLYAYSGQNVIVAKFAVSIKEIENLHFTWASSLELNPEVDYDAAEGTIEVGVGETVPLYFHTELTNTWGRDGYANSAVEFEIEDENIASYVGKAEEEGAESYVLTGLEEGTTTMKVILADADGKYKGGNELLLTVVVE